MKKYKCTICKYEYDPAQGDPTQGIAPGTPFEQLPADWTSALGTFSLAIIFVLFEIIFKTGLFQMLFSFIVPM